MNSILQKISYGLLALIFVFGAGVSFTVIPSAAYAAPISRTNPITLHITNSRFVDTAATARQNLLQGAFQQGGATAQAQMQANLDNGNIQIVKDAASAWDDSTSYLSFEGKQVGGMGKQGVQDGFKKILEDPNNLPPGATTPKENDVICIVPRPGQNTDYGPLTDKPFPLEGQVRDLEAVHPIIEGHVADESETNFELRKLGSQLWEAEKAAALKAAPQNGTQKLAANPPSEAQAKQYIASMGGNPDARGKYMIGGTEVPVGQYKANDTNDRTGIVFDESCENPKQKGKAPEPGTPGGQQFAPPTQPNQGGSGGGLGGGEGLGGAGGLGALGSLLPLLLMQSLLGGQQGGQGQNGQGTNGYGSGYGNTGTTNCATQGVYPVCGSDGKTYTNTCYLNQYGAVQVSSGVCVTTSPTPTPDFSKLITQLIASGVPQSVINSIINSISSIISHASGDAKLP